MSRLQDTLRDKNNTVEHRKEFSDFHKIKKKKELNKKIIKYTAICGCIAVVLGAIYVPQYFIKDNEDSIEVKLNVGAVTEYNAALKNASEEDWDKDGVINSIEQQKGLSVWNADSDGDGFSDYYELSNNLKANEKDQSLTDMMKTILKSKDEKYDMAYKVNGVVLWADDIKSRTYGRVIRTPDGGYQFTNFKGYAQFPEGTCAYRIKNGKHVKLKYRKKEDAYYIKEDELVYVYDSKPDMVNRITFFGKSFYTSDNFFTKILSGIFPDKGVIIASSRMASIDADNELAGSTVVSSVGKATYTDKINRFSANTNTLDDLVTLRSLIQNNQAVPVSFYSDKKGEYLGIVYGYTRNGDLIIADYYSKDYVGILNIGYTAETLYNGNDITQKEIFTFSGLGFISENGDRINFLDNNFH